MKPACMSGTSTDDSPAGVSAPAIDTPIVVPSSIMRANGLAGLAQARAVVGVEVVVDQIGDFLRALREGRGADAALGVQHGRGT